MTNDKNYGRGRHEEHMFALHGTKFIAPGGLKTGTQIRIEALLEHHGVARAEAEETAVAVYKGLERYRDNPPEKQAEFIAMMVGPLLRDPAGGFTAKADPAKVKAVVDGIAGMAARAFGGEAPTIETRPVYDNNMVPPRTPKF